MVWYEEEIKRLEIAAAAFPQQPRMVFYGSSSIRLWHTLDDDFKGYAPFNMGFGGSTLAACSWYFDRLFTRITPHALVIYAGDNDLGDGRSAEEVLLIFSKLVQLIQHRFGEIPVGFISIKPSVRRWEIIDKVKRANLLIQKEISKEGGKLCYINIFDAMTDQAGYPRREYLASDGLHINDTGYELWNRIIQQHISSGQLHLANQPLLT